MKNDMVPVMEAIIHGNLDKCTIDIDSRVSVCVVMASGGYPGKYKKGLPITGLEAAERMKDVMVFHAGTGSKADSVVANGDESWGSQPWEKPLIKPLKKLTRPWPKSNGIRFIFERISGKKQ